MRTDEPRDLQGVELGYDPRDIDEKGIYRVVGYFFLFALFFFGIGAIVYIYVGKWGIASRFDPRKPAIIGPKLQGNVAAKVDIMEMRQQERRTMEATETYEETGPNGQKVTLQRIPVEQAMQILAQRGLPDIKNDQKATSPGNTIPQNAVGPAGASTDTSPAQTGAVPTPPTGSSGTIGP